MIALVEKHGIRYHEKTLGQLFCDDSAVRIVNLLQTECEEVKVILRSGAEVVSVMNISSDNARFRVDTRTGSFTAQSVVVATGGLSIPKMGATGIGYDIARSFGHTLVEPRAGLVPLVFAPQDRDNWCDLTGLSTEAIASAPLTEKPRGRPRPAPSFREKLLITHRGLSGPAVLQISSYWHPGKPLTFDLAPGLEVFAPLLASSAGRDDLSLLQILSAVLPARFAKRWLMTRSEIDYTNAGLANLEKELHNWTLTPAGTEGFEKAEVTVGGVGHQRTRCTHHGEPPHARPLLHRRSRRRNRMAGWIQLSMGLGFRGCCRGGAFRLCHTIGVMVRVMSTVGRIRPILAPKQLTLHGSSRAADDLF